MAYNVWIQKICQRDSLSPRGGLVGAEYWLVVMIVPSPLLRGYYLSGNAQSVKNMSQLILLQKNTWFSTSG